MERRAFGLETEYAITNAGMPGHDRIDSEHLAFDLFNLPWKAVGKDRWLENGARLYIDGHGSHPEYATPECDSVRQAVAADRAGMLRLSTMLKRLNARTKGTTRDQAILIRNNTDRSDRVISESGEAGQRQAYGCHENYLSPRSQGGATEDSTTDSLVNGLTPFFVVRQLMCGAGELTQPAPNQWNYVFSPRAQFFQVPRSHDTTDRRALFSLRSEYHAQGDQRRIHVVVGDANMSEWSTFLKLGSTHLVLRMIEDGETFTALNLDDPVDAIKVTSGDLTGRAHLVLAGGQQTTTALRILETYLERAENRYGHEGGETKQILNMWRFAVNAFSLPGPDANPPTVDLIAERLSTRVDWAIKYRLIEGFRRRYRLELGDPRVDAVNLDYHDIDPQTGLFARLENRGAIVRITSVAEVEALADRPPSTTRAWLRGRWIRAMRANHGGHYHVDWEWLRDTSGSTERELRLDNPLRNTSPPIDAEIARLEKRASISPLNPDPPVPATGVALDL